MDVEVLLPRQSSCSLMSFRLRSSSVEDLNRCASSSTSKAPYLLPIKSKYLSEFRRLCLQLGGKVPYPTQEQLKDLILELHNIDKKAVKDFVISYTDHNSDELPLSNDDTVLKALDNSNKLLRINLQKRAESLEEQYGYGIDIEKVRKDRSLPISGPHDFRKVSSIMDADLLPMELRRVQLCKYGTNQPLGLYIRNGPSVRLTLNGPVIKEGIFISRLVEGALAASTNLIHPNDEIIEVNGINVADKTLDQVTDILIANAKNLVLTLRINVQYPYGHPFFPTSPMGSPYNNLPPQYHGSPCTLPRMPLASYANPNWMMQSEFSHPFSRQSTVRLSDQMENFHLSKSPYSKQRPFSVLEPNSYYH